MSTENSTIIIPDNIKELVELLAINVHNSWMEQRFQEGWVLGEQRNDALKTHPCLVPYELLPEGEKEYDRITAIETIKTILSLGFSIERKTAKIVTAASRKQGSSLGITLDAEEDDLAERFEAAFNQIHVSLKKMAEYKGDLSFVALLNNLNRKFSLVSKFSDVLKQYAKLRNALVHELYKKREYIAVPNVNVVKNIERIAGIFNSPPNVLTIATKQVLYCQQDDALVSVLNRIIAYKCTSVPIYKGSSFIGLLTEDGITRWLSSQLEKSLTLDFSAIPASVILNYELPSNVVFVAKDTTVVDIELLFSQQQSQNKKIEAIIITANGLKDQPPLGIITSWDLIKIEE